jgi:hypothetical protein
VVAIVVSVNTVTIGAHAALAGQSSGSAMAGAEH